MQFIPYKINHTNESHDVAFFENEFKMLNVLQTLEETLEFLEEQAVEVVKFKEGGEKALNCKCTRNTIGEKPDGFLVVSEEDGTFTLVNKISGAVYGFNVTPVTYFKYKTFSSSARATTRPSRANNLEQVDTWGEMLRELRTKGRASLRHVDEEETDVPDAPPVPVELKEYFRKLKEPKDIFESVRENLKTATSDEDGNLFYFRGNPIDIRAANGDRVEYDPYIEEYLIRDDSPREWRIEIGDYTETNPFVHEYRFGITNDDELSVDNQQAKAEQEVQFGKNWLQFDYFAKKYE